MVSVSINVLYNELKNLKREVEKTNALLLSLVPEEKVSAKEAARLKKIKAEMDAGKEVPYSRSLF